MNNIQRRESGSGSEALKGALADAARRSALGKVAPGEAPSASALLAAVGGLRGIVEALFPGLAFLVTFAVTRELLPSVIAPAVVAAVFILVRLLTRGPIMSAVAGALGVGFSAVVAVMTGNVNDSFMPGLVTNVAFLMVLLASIVARWPLLGVIAGVLTGDSTGWRESASKRRVAVVATALWCGLFALRLLVQVPMYLASATEALAATKLIMGVPFYAATLWVTWLLMRAAYRRDVPVDSSVETGE